MLLQARGHAEAHVAERADVERDPLLGEVRRPARDLRSPGRRGRSARHRAPRIAPQTLSGPACSPACGALCRPAASARSNQGANGSGGAPASAPASPSATTPISWPSIEIAVVWSASGSTWVTPSFHCRTMLKIQVSSTPKSARARAPTARRPSKYAGLRHAQDVVNAGRERHLGVADVLARQVRRQVVGAQARKSSAVRRQRQAARNNWMKWSKSR